MGATGTLVDPEDPAAVAAAEDATQLVDLIQALPREIDIVPPFRLGEACFLFSVKAHCIQVAFQG